MDAFHVLGLDSHDLVLYEHLLSDKSTTPEELSDVIREPAAQVTEGLDHLRSLGLVTRIDDPTPRYRAAPPSGGLGALIFECRDEILRAESLIQLMQERYQPPDPPGGLGRMVERIEGSMALRHCSTELRRGSQRSFRSFVKAGELSAGDLDHDEDEAALDRRVQYRIIAERALVGTSHFADQASRATRRGMEVRVAPTLPARLTIADQDRAIVAMPGQRTASASLIHRSGLLIMLDALFERYWHSSARLSADPAADVSPSSDDLSEQDRKLLRLLNLGFTDGAAAHHLGQSLRTVQRRVSAMMDQAQVSSRLQLGAAAQRRGWL